MTKFFTLIAFPILALATFSSTNVLAQSFNMGGGTNFVTNCNGVLYDSGGPTGNYGGNQNLTFTICPSSNPACISMLFSNVQTENTADFINVYDGPNTSSPLLTPTPISGDLADNLNICGVQASSGCLTVTFQSSSTINLPGFEASWSCSNTACDGSLTCGPNYDCGNAFVVCDNGNLNQNLNGIGLENIGGTVEAGCLSGGEHQASWYIIQINDLTPAGSSLEFTIDPNAANDYDFAVYGPDVECDALGIPIRCSFAAGNTDTGLGNGAFDNTEGAGGDGFVAPLTVNPGEQYFILVDNWSNTNQGFQLTWGGSAIPPPGEPGGLECDIACTLEADAGEDISGVCPSDGVQIGGSPALSGGDPPYTVNWSASEPGFTFIPTQPNPTVTGPEGFNGSVTFTLSVTDGSCQKTDQMTITYDNSPDPTAFELVPSTICTGEEVTADYLLDPTGLTFSWNFGAAATPATASGAPANVSWATPGTKTVSFTVTGECPATASIDVEVTQQLATPTLTCNSTLTSATFEWLSANASQYQLDIYINNVLLSSDLVNITQVPVAGNAGDEIRVEITAFGSGFCDSETAVETCIIEDCTPPAGFEIGNVSLEPYCTDGFAFDFTGTPAGGTFSGAGITDAAAGTFDPSLAGSGSHLIVYEYTDPGNGCVSSTDTTVTVITAPTADFTVDGLLCITDAATLTYTGNAPADATYEWEFLDADAVPSATSGQGPITVTYGSAGTKTVRLSVDDEGCISNTEQLTIEVSEPLATPDVSCGTLTPNTAQFIWDPITGATSYDIEVTVGGFVTTLTNIPDSQFTESGLSIGDEVTISVVAVGDPPCGNSTAGTQSCTTVDCPDVAYAFTGISNLYCADEPDVSFAVVPADPGDFSSTSPGFTPPNNFSPSDAGPGTHSITFEYLNPANGCFYSESIDIQVLEVPSAEFTLSETTICSDQYVEAAYIGPLPAGADYTWSFQGASPNGATGQGPVFPHWPIDTEGTFDVTLVVEYQGCSSEPYVLPVTVAPAIETPGISCGAISTDEVTFVWDPIAGISNYQLEIVIDGVPNPSPFITGATTYTEPGLSAGTDVQVTITALGSPPCGSSADSTITCTTSNCVPIDLDSDLAASYCVSDGVASLSGTPPGGVFSTGSAGLSGNNFDPAVAGVGTHTITYTYTDALGCVSSETFNTEVFGPPTATFNLPASLCSDDAANISYTGTANPANATFDWDFGANATPATATGPGPHAVSWSVSGVQSVSLTVSENGCSSQANVQNIDIIQEPGSPNIYCQDVSSESVQFCWDPVPGATGYNIALDVAGSFSFSSTTNTCLEEADLTPGTDVSISVTPVGTAPCGNGPANNLTCTALDCSDAVNIDGLPASICLNDGATVFTTTPLGGLATGNGVTAILDAYEFDPAAAGVGLHTVTFNYTAPSGCEYTVTEDITVNANPLADFDLPAEICTGQTTGINFTGTAAAGATYAWNFGANAIPATSAAPNPAAVQWTAGGNKTVTLTVTQNGCESNEASYNIDVSEPLPDFTIDCGITSQTQVSFDWPDVAGATDYSVDISINGNAPSNSVQANSDFTQPGLSPGDNVSITVTAIGGTVCGNGNPISQNCIAQDCPVINPSIVALGTNYCETNNPVPLIGSPADGENGGTGVFTIGGDVVTEFDPSLYSPGIYTVTYTYTDASGSCQYTETQDVNIVAIPTADFDLPSETCMGDEVTITFTGSAGTAANFNWNFGADATPGTASDEGPHLVSWSTGGTKTVNLGVVESVCAATPVSLNIEVYEPLEAPTINCDNTTSSAATFTWNDVGGNGTYAYETWVNGVSQGTGTTGDLTYTEPGLNPDDEVEISVVALSDGPCGDSPEGNGTCILDGCPTVNPIITGLNAQYCENGAAVVLGGAPSGGSFTVDGNPETEFDPTAYAPGNHVVTYEYVNGTCTYPVSQPVEVVALPVASITVAPDACMGLGNEISVAFNGTPPAGATFDWNFGANAVPSSAVTEGPHDVYWSSAGTKSVTLTISANGCQSVEASVQVEVSAPLAAPLVSCLSSTTSSVTAGWNPIAGVTDYEVTVTVDAGTPETSTISDTQILVDALSTGSSVDVSVIAIGGAPCGNSPAGTTNCVVEDCPPETLEITGLDSEYCTGDAAVTLTGTPAGGEFSFDGIPGIITEFDPSDGAGLYIVVYTYTDGNCTYTESQNVLVTAEPVADFDISGEVCTNEEATVTFTGTAGAAATYSWDFGVDATPATASGIGPHSVSWPSSGSKDIDLEVDQNGCTDNITLQATVAEPLGSLTVNCGILTQNSVQFTWNALAGATGYDLEVVINAGAPSTDSITDADHTVGSLNPGDVVDITVTPLGDPPCGNGQPATATCIAQDCDPVTINFVGLDASYCNSDAAVTLEAEPAGGIFTIDGNPAAITEIDPATLATGLHNIEYELNIGSCQYFGNTDVSILASPSASISVSASGICIADAADIDFDGTAGAGASFAWGFGTDATPATAGTAGPHSVSWSSTGDKDVFVTVTDNGCTDIASTTISVEDTLAIPSVLCTNTTQNEVSFGWNSVAGAVDYSIAVSINGIPEPVFSTTDLTHTVPGLAPGDVVEIAVEPIGDGLCGNGGAGTADCTAQDCPTISFEITGLDGTYCIDETAASLSATPDGSGTFAGTGVTGNSFDPSLAGAGNHTITYEFTDASGCPYSASIDVTVLEPPTADFTVGIAELCAGETATVTFAGQAVAGAVYNWDFGAGATPATANTAGPHTVTWSLTGTPSISLSVEENGCLSNVASETVTVNGVTASSPGTINIDAGASADIALTVTAADPDNLTYAWSPATDLSCADCGSPTASPSETTTYTVTVSDLAGCTATTSTTVEVNVREEVRQVLIPNAFSPNDDTKNDVFGVVQHQDILNVDLKIFNRWGEKVFESYNGIDTWDGYHNGEQCPIGTYVYYALITFTDGETELKQGNLTLIR